MNLLSGISGVTRSFGRWTGIKSESETVKDYCRDFPNTKENLVAMFNDFQKSARLLKYVPLNELTIDQLTVVLIKPILAFYPMFVKNL